MSQCTGIQGEARSVHSPHFVPACIDSAFMGHQLLGPEDIGMTKCPMQRPGQWGRQTLIP